MAPCRELKLTEVRSPILSFLQGEVTPPPPPPPPMPLMLVLVLLLSPRPSFAGFNETLHGRFVSSFKGFTKASCPVDWVIAPSGTKCFGYFGESLSWNDSESACNFYGGHLAALSSWKELNLTQSLCNATRVGCWVGGELMNTSQGSRWMWSDNSSHWDGSLLPGNLPSPGCNSMGCPSNSSVGSCTLVANRSASLTVEECQNLHSFVCLVERDNRCSHVHCHREYFIILVVVSGIIFCTAVAVVVWLLLYKRRKKRKRSHKFANPSASSALAPPSWKLFNKDELRSITKSFSEGSRLLGDAKTGGTYTGVLPDGSKVAVKRLKRSSFQRKREFYSEIGRVAKLHHPSLVAIKGCCYDHGDRFIVYEFIANGPLDRWLHHVPRGGKSLDWAMRMKISITLAQGIAFLHDKVKPHVVHRDIRASNVLLDEDFGAHLIGVGLSKFVPWEAMQERTMMAGGTHGYLAPEFVYRNEITTKSDVYSFGVLLLETISGRKPAQAVDSVGWQSIFEWATPLVQAHRYLELLDPYISSLSSEIPETGVIQKVVDLVYTCTQHVPSMRPRMSHVVHQLQQLVPPVVEM